MHFVVGMQDKILLTMHSAGSSRYGGANENGTEANGVSKVCTLRASSRGDEKMARVDRALDGHWRRLVSLLQLERVMHRPVQALLAQVRMHVRRPLRAVVWRMVRARGVCDNKRVHNCMGARCMHASLC